MSALAEMDCIDIAVPTPLRKTKDPDMSYVVQAVEAVQQHLRKGQLVSLESTTYPGTTDELVKPMLEETGLKAGQDFYLAFSPERVDPANPAVPDEGHPEGRRRVRQGQHGHRLRAVRVGRDEDRAGQLDASSPRWPSCSRTRSGR